MYFSALGVSMLGDWLTTVALVVVLFRLTGSPAGPAGYIFVRVASRLAGPWWGGKLADRFSPRVSMAASSLLQGAAVASLAASSAARSVPAILVTVAVAQFSGALGRPSQIAIVPSLVSPGALPRANAFYGFVLNGSIFLGPAIGGLLLARFGPTPLFLLDAATFFLAAVTFMRLAPRPRSAAVDVVARRRPLWEALSLTRVRTVAAANFVSGLTVTATQAVLIVAAHDRYASDAAVGFLYSTVGFGGTVGALMALRWIPHRDWARFAVFISAIVEACALGGFAAPVTAAVGVVLLAAGAASSSLFDAWGPTEVQRSATADVIGRYSSVIFLAQYSGMVLGAAWALVSAPSLGWDRTIEAACAVALVVLGVTWVLPGRERLARSPGENRAEARAVPYPGAGDTAPALQRPQSSEESA